MDKRTGELYRLFYEESDMNVVFRSLLKDENIKETTRQELWPSPLPPKKCYPKEGVYTFYKNVSSREILCVWRGLGFSASAEIFMSVPENLMIRNIRIARYKRNGQADFRATYGAYSIPGSASIWDEMKKLLVHCGYEPA